MFLGQGLSACGEENGTYIARKRRKLVEIAQQRIKHFTACNPSHSSSISAKIACYPKQLQGFVTRSYELYFWQNFVFGAVLIITEVTSVRVHQSSVSKALQCENKAKY